MHRNTKACTNRGYKTIQEDTRRYTFASYYWLLKDTSTVVTMYLTRTFLTEI